MGEYIVQIEQFRKVYGSFVAVDDLSFSVRPGEIFALVGPNGSGKTSTLECMEGLRRPDGGTIRVAGTDPASDPARLRDLIGVQLQSSSLPDNISVREAMRFFCAYHRAAPRDDLLERLGLHDKLNTQYFELSGGQKRRLALVLAIAHNPPVVILDEPTAALDVISRNELHAVMAELRAGGTTIILSSHDMAEVEKLADRVGVLLKGRLVATGTPRELTATGAQLTKVSIRTEMNSLQSNRQLPGTTHTTTSDDYLICFSDDVAATVMAALGHIRHHDDALIDLRVERPSLEDRFLEITDSREGIR